jgi:penicillin-insensitive murein DD-endopeptidase
MLSRRLLLLVLAIATGPASAQDLGTLDPKPLPALANPNDPTLPARELFGRKADPVSTPPRSIGFYSKGCLAGAVALPINGETWQVMRLSRNRNWGNPHLIELLERLSVKVHKVAGWPGLLVGDISQPRGGPMFTGHASHQVGLDADIWLTPMPNRELSRAEREEMSATMVVAESRIDVDPNVWTPGHFEAIKAAAEEPQVQRIFVNAAIKKALCREAKGNRAWLNKVRPMYGHDYHFHIRIKCPDDSAGCKPQDPVPPGDGCSSGDLSFWFTDAVIHPERPKEPAEPSKGPTLAQLPAACRGVVTTP